MKILNAWESHVVAGGSASEAIEMGAMFAGGYAAAQIMHCATSKKGYDQASAVRATLMSIAYPVGVFAGYHIDKGVNYVLDQVFKSKSES